MSILEYRELIKNLVISDLKNRYSNSILGFVWSMLNPLMMMLILYIVFGSIFRMTEKNFGLYILTGITTWRFFSYGTTVTMTSIVNKQSLVTKIYIPREIITFSASISAFISSILEFLVLILLLIIFGISITENIILFPLISIIYFIILYGSGLILASLYVYYRDINQIWEIILQIGFFVSPITYPLSLIPEQFKFYYMLNPITIIIEMYRDILLTGKIPEINDFVIVIISGIMIYIIGKNIFAKLSPRFAEKI